MTGTKRAIAVYSRKSRFTGKGESIGNQVELCREYVRSHYGTDAQVEIFEDEGFSGGNLNRPDFRRMLDGVRRGRFHAIVVYRLDRISRNIGDFAALIDELTGLDVSFVSIREQFDTATPMGRAMMFIISVFSQLERETIAERIRDNMHALARTGRWLGGNPPTGYTSESVSNMTMDGKSRKLCQLKVVPEEAEVVHRIFELYLRTDSLTAVEAELLRRKICSRTGKNYTRFSIRGILKNPVYMAADGEAYRYFQQRGARVCGGMEEFDGSGGIMPYNRTEQEKGKSTVLLPEEAWIIAAGSHLPLVSSETWIRVQESLERNRSKAYRKPRKNEALLTGLLFCACGERMYPKLSGRTTGTGSPAFSYVCRMKRVSGGTRCSIPNCPGNRLDGLVLAELGRLSGDGSYFAELLNRGEKEVLRDTDSGGTDGLEAELRANEARIENLLDALALAGDGEARAAVMGRIEKLTRRNRELSRLRSAESCPQEPSRTPENWDFASILLQMDTEQKREAFRRLIRRVQWNGRGAEVYFDGDTERNRREDSK